MDRIDYTPDPDVNGHTRTTAVPLKVYRSSVGDAITFAFDADGSGMYRRGLRLNREQGATLRDQLTAWLGWKDGA